MLGSTLGDLSGQPQGVPRIIFVGEQSRIDSISQLGRNPQRVSGAERRLPHLIEVGTGEFSFQRHVANLLLFALPDR
ncbi:hypothetical protein [Actinoplanes sp. NPDC049265]|uniref:hypothetical protein n=1 Tax=Actinoplanes sp. NPDC049265 TaxID=3363902 RepID=UPI0037150B4D